MADLIANWGYLAVLIGTACEGEAVLLLAGIFARDGLLRLDLVMLCGMLGSVAGDQVWFWVGRRFGYRWMLRHPDKTVRIRRVTALLERWGTGYVLCFRFLYGLRTISPIAIGLTSIPARRFALLNVIAAILWSVTIGGLGYVCGEALETLFRALAVWQKALLGLAVIALFLGVLYGLEQIYLRFQVPPE